MQLPETPATQALLESLGLAQYLPAFRDNHIDDALLPALTDHDLYRIGIEAVGHRKRLLQAIAGIAIGKEAAARISSGGLAGSSAERRQLTVMFVDMVGFTTLASRLDPEELHDVLRAYRQAVTGEIARFVGHVAKFMGDGVLAYFGWPLAHEDDAERAIRAGLALRAEVARLPAPGGEPLACRVGTGVVVVGNLVGEGTAREEEVLGQTPNLAARLQGLAEFGQVVIAESTRLLLGDIFALKDLGSKSVKGIGVPVRAFAVTAERPSESRCEARSGPAVLPMLGRDTELALLLGRWTLAKSDEGQGVLLVGDAGIGKSRIVQALREVVGGEPHTLVRYQCSPYHRDSALWPAVQQLGQAAGFAHHDPLDVRLEKLEALLAELHNVAKSAPLIASLLGLDGGARYDQPSLTPQAQRAWTLDALVEQLLGLAKKAPVLMVLEDAHWIDPTTLELIELCLGRIADARILILLTSRPDGLPGLVGRSHITRLTINRLGRVAVEAIIARLSGDKGLPAEIIDAIITHADGVPLFVEELTKAVLETGEAAIPASLHDSLMARLDRFAEVKQVAQIAACIGREFSHRLLSEVAQRPGAELDAALNKLVAGELIFRRGTPPGASYSFKHALVQDAAYHSLLRSKREQLHARILDVLTGLGESSAETLARHAAIAGRHADALSHFEAAGRVAHFRGAQREAAAHYRSALAALEQLGDRFAGGAAARARLLLARGTAVGGVEGWRSEAMLAHLRDAIAAAEASGEHEVLFDALCWLWSVDNAGGNHRSSLANAKRLVSTVAGFEEPSFEAAARATLGCSLLMRGRIADAELEFDRAIGIRPHEASPSSTRSRDYGLFAFCVGAIALWHLGYPERARARSEAGLTHAEAGGGAFDVPLARTFLAQLDVRTRDVLRAEANAVVALSFSRRQGVAHLECDSAIFLGWARAMRGKLSEGRALIDGALKQRREMGALVGWPSFLSWRSEVLALGGEHAAALDVVDEAIDHAERTGEVEWIAELHRQRAELGLRLNRGVASAEAELGRALEIARTQGSRMLELRVASSLARLWGEQVGRREAYDLLAPVYRSLIEGSDTADLTEARELLEGLR